MLIRNIFPRQEEMIEITHHSRLLQSFGPDNAVLKQKNHSPYKKFFHTLAFNLKCQ